MSSGSGAVDAYISGFPAEVAGRLRRIRQAILEQVEQPFR